MKIRNYLYCLLALFFFSTTLSAKSELPVYSYKYDPARDAIADGIAAIELAKRTHRRVLIEVGGDWCSWCHRLDRFLEKNTDIKQALHRHFVLLKVNYSDENYNEAFLKVFPPPLGYPHMYITDAKGVILYSKDTSELVEQSQYSRKQFLSFLNKWKNP